MIARTRHEMSVAEFDAWVALPENADRDYEYIAGEVYEVVSNFNSSQIALMLGAFITVFVTQHRLGQISGADGGYMINGQRYIPDVGFISWERQLALLTDTYAEKAPDLAVEVFSPTDSEKKLSLKISNYLAAGTLVWAIYPDEKEVHVHDPVKGTYVVGFTETLSGGTALPGFSVVVKDIFPKEQTQEDADS